MSFEKAREKLLDALGITPVALDDYGLYDAIVQHPDTQRQIENALREKLNMLGYKTPPVVPFDYSDPHVQHAAYALLRLSQRTTGQKLAQEVRRHYTEECGTLTPGKGEEVRPDMFLSDQLNNNIGDFSATLVNVMETIPPHGTTATILVTPDTRFDFQIAQHALLAAETIASTYHLRRYAAAATELEHAVRTAERLNIIKPLHRLPNVALDNESATPSQPSAGFLQQANAFLADFGLEKHMLSGVPENAALWEALTHHRSLEPLVQDAVGYCLNCLGYKAPWHGMALDYTNPEEMQAVHRLLKEAHTHTAGKSAGDKADIPSLRQFIDDTQVLDRDNHDWLAGNILKQMKDSSRAAIRQLVSALRMMDQGTLSLNGYQDGSNTVTHASMILTSMQQVADHYGLNTAARMTEAAEVLAQRHHLTRNPHATAHVTVTAAQRLGVVESKPQQPYLH